ncbi:Adenylyltransferase and sulfurtransferase like protein [Plasmodiophora brassicae]|uniref:Adenylyltransferase and sulfurtransferase MOCS3 homolog n=1 Tax=Plasmodiophora brassicae TaxID=37360 RepID=A0A3P3XZ70_PLABS|nr:unnamed protein product [Plasmodiophora brassicae]
MTRSLEARLPLRRSAVPESVTEPVWRMTANTFRQCGLKKGAIERYGRQLILRDWGASAQERVCQARVLVVGAGGLGCPVAVYLAGAGIGHIAIVDHDRVERSNLHRQVLHHDANIGDLKAESLRRACLAVNPDIDVQAISVRFTSDNALELVAGYDVIVDATDNVESRYLINDVGVLSGIPVVSGSALGLEGQLTVYGYKRSTCYRCVFPEPPPKAAVGDCNNAGVLGPIPGVIGTLQAVEVLKVVANVGNVLSARLLVFDGLTMTTRVVRLRGRNPACAVCGDEPTITALAPSSSPTVCSPGRNPDINHISVTDFGRMRGDGIVIDVRDAHQFAICSLNGSRNIPIAQLAGETLRELLDESRTIYCICRRGVMSQVAAARLVNAGATRVFSVGGGLTAYAKHVDPEFPIY